MLVRRLKKIQKLQDSSKTNIYEKKMTVIGALVQLAAYVKKASKDKFNLSKANMLDQLHTFKKIYILAYDQSIGINININENDKKIRHIYNSYKIREYLSIL